MTEKTQKFWSYTCINWDLLRDDLDSAVDIYPVRFYRTREKALEALIEEVNAYWHEEEGYDKLTTSNMKWEESVRNSEDGSLLGHEFCHEDSDDTYYLYEMELVD